MLRDHPEYHNMNKTSQTLAAKQHQKSEHHLKKEYKITICVLQLLLTLCGIKPHFRQKKKKKKKGNRVITCLNKLRT
jgi:hypothetical protein